MEKEYIIRKWLNDDLSEQESLEFRQREDYDELMGIVEHARRFKASHFSEVEDFESFKTRLESKDSETRKMTWMRPLLRMAAVLAVGVALFYFLFRDDHVQIRTIAGEKTTLELPDASMVVVNALSEIRYSPDSWAEDRAIQLEGEAFFDVSEGSTFSVSTPSGTVTVLGTEFNVKQRGNFIEVHCFEGKVLVDSPVHEKVLEQGEHIRIEGDEVVSGEHYFTKPQWTENKSSFQSVPLQEVIDELERQYGVEVLINNVKTDTLFTGGFIHDDLENALKAITEPLGLEFEIGSSNQVSIQTGEK